MFPVFSKTSVQEWHELHGKKIASLDNDLDGAHLLLE
jgi:hypothetical protein